MTAVRAAPLTVRLTQADKDALVDAAHAAGFDPSVAARHVLELFIRRMQAMEPADFIAALAEINAALKANAAADQPELVV